MNTVQVMHTTMIIDHIYSGHIDAVQEYFAKYSIGKINNIVFHMYNGDQEDGYAIIYLDFWYDNIVSKNMYNRIINNGEVRLVYDDPYYCVMRFYDTVDDRQEYLKRENTIEDEDEGEGEAEREGMTMDDRQDYMVDISTQLEKLFNCYSEIKKEVQLVSFTQKNMHEDLKKILYVKRSTPIKKNKKNSKKNKSINTWARRLRNNIS